MKRTLLFSFLVIGLLSCKKEKPSTDQEVVLNEDPATYAEIGSLDIGELGAAEISAFDPVTNKLFVVKNENEGEPNQVNRIEVVDFANPSNMKATGFISVTPYGGAVNSVAVHDGKLAAAIQANNKQANGKVV